MLSLAIEQRQRKNAPGIIEARYRSDTNSTTHITNPKRQDRQKYLTHIDGTLSDVAVQDNPDFQDVSQRPFVPLYTASAEEQFGKRDNGGHDGRGHGRGYGRGHGRGRSRVRDLVQNSVPPGQGITPH